MAEIKHQQPGGSPEVSGSVIHIPNDADMGTGTFTTDTKTRYAITVWENMGPLAK